ncbi:MAG: hypothetical protein ACYS76_13885 [Planctomycetota bacterium]|jgi:hypothetical protein
MLEINYMRAHGAGGNARAGWRNWKIGKWADELVAGYLVSQAQVGIAGLGII